MGGVFGLAVAVVVFSAGGLERRELRAISTICVVISRLTLEGTGRVRH